MKKLFTTKNIAMMAVFAAFAEMLMLIIEIPLPFIAPDFYKFDLSEIPILIGTFIMGPVAGIIMELVKNLLHLIAGHTFGVGELANFLVGCAFVVPAGIIYKRNKTLKGAIIGLLSGIASIGVVGMLANYFILLPFYGMKLPNKFMFVLTTVLPFNLVKGAIITVVTFPLYKPLSKFIKRIEIQK